MRGDHKGKKGRVLRINKQEDKVEIQGDLCLEREKLGQAFVFSVGQDDCSLLSEAAQDAAIDLFP